MIVVGSGPCGAAAATRLAERGVRVVMLDAGLARPARAAGARRRSHGLAAQGLGRVLRAPSRRHIATRTSIWVSSLSLGGLSNYWTVGRAAVRPGGLRRRRADRRTLRVAGDLRRARSVLRAARVADGADGRRPDSRRSARASPATGTGCRPTGEPSPPRRRSTATASARCRWPGVARRWSCAAAPSSPATTAWCCPSSDRPVVPLDHGRLRDSGSSGRPSAGRVDVGRVRRSPDRATASRSAGVPSSLAAGAIDSTVIVLRSTSDDFPNGLGQLGRARRALPARPSPRVVAGRDCARR